MNLQNGMKRVAIVASVLWVLGMGAYQYNDANKPAEGLTIKLDKSDIHFDSNGITQKDHAQVREQRLAITFLPALALLIIIPVGGWLTRGFKTEGK